MKIGREKLQTALEIVKPGLANKEMVEQSTSFAFLDGKVVTYNDEISIQHPVEGLEIEGAIKADELYKLLNKISAKEIDIKITDKEIQLSSGRTKAGITLETEIKLPLDDSVAHVGKWKPLPEDFLKFVGFAAASCSKNQSEYKFTCVHITRQGVVEASDGYKITHCILKEEMPTKSFLLPSFAAEQVVKLVPTHIAEGKGWIHFKNEEGTILSARILEEEYGNTSKFLEAEGPLLTLPASIKATLDRAEVFSKRDQILAESITISVKDAKLTVSSRSESGWFEEVLNIEYDGKPLEFDITPYLLKGILNETQGCRVDKTKLKFEGDGWIHVTSLKSTK
jgi:hypothetical protein